MQALKAILVDDELNSLQNLQFKIQEYCPSVKVVAQSQNPEEAIRLIQQHKPDVIFLDIEMPKMNGFELAKAVRSHQVLKSVPMIAISSKADKKYTDKGIEAGFDIYIEKLKPETLLGAVATLSSPRRVA